MGLTQQQRATLDSLAFQQDCAMRTLLAPHDSALDAIRTRFQAQRDSVFTQGPTGTNGSTPQGHPGAARSGTGEGAEENMLRKLIVLLAAPAILGAQQATTDPTLRPISMAEAVRLAKENNVSNITAANSVRSANNSVRAARAAMYPDADGQRRAEQERRRAHQTRRTRSSTSSRCGQYNTGLSIANHAVRRRQDVRGRPDAAGQRRRRRGGAGQHRIQRRPLR